MVENNTYELSWDLINDVMPDKGDEFLVCGVGDAFYDCIRNKGAVDIYYISEKAGVDKDNVVKELEGVIILNPVKFNGNIYEGYETVEEYLSGNLHTKRKFAQNATAMYNGLFDSNIKLLDSVMRCNVYFDEVDLQPGMSFVSGHVIDLFVEHLFGKFLSMSYHRSGSTVFNVRHDEITGEWEIPFKNRYKGTIKNIATYGTRYKTGMVILEDILNNRDSVVYENSTRYSDSGTRRINKAATAMVQEKRELIINEFDRWVKKTPEIREIVEQSYLEQYGYIRRRVFNGKFISNQWGKYTLYDYQRDSVARIIFTRNCLLALSVGLGKTVIMIVAALELMRMKIAKKNCFFCSEQYFFSVQGCF